MAAGGGVGAASRDQSRCAAAGHNHVACRRAVTDKPCGCWQGGLEMFHPIPGRRQRPTLTRLGRIFLEEDIHAR